MKRIACRCRPASERRRRQGACRNADSAQITLILRRHQPPSRRREATGVGWRGCRPEPGVVVCGLWRPGGGRAGHRRSRWFFLVGRIHFRGHHNFLVGRIGSLENREKKAEPTKPKQSTTDEEKWQGKPADSKGLPSSAAAPTARSPGPSTSPKTHPPVAALSNSV